MSGNTRGYPGWYSVFYSGVDWRLCRGATLLRGRMAPRFGGVGGVLAVALGMALGGDLGGGPGWWMPPKIRQLVEQNWPVDSSVLF